jgi:hypothetical protein
MMEYESKRAELERLIDEGIESAETEPLLTRDQAWRMLDKSNQPSKARKRK